MRKTGCVHRELFGRCDGCLRQKKTQEKLATSKLKGQQTNFLSRKAQENLATSKLKGQQSNSLSRFTVDILLLKFFLVIKNIEKAAKIRNKRLDSCATAAARSNNDLFWL